jgi:glutathione S-transferase
MGRGEFVRLMFAELDIEHEDVGKSAGSGEVAKFLQGNPLGGPPTYAPPVLVNTTTGLALSQTPVILQYLGRRFGLAPDDDDAFALACAANCTIHDFLAQGRLAFHPPPDTNRSYHDQVDAARPAIEFHKINVLPKQLAYLEALLRSNGGGHGFLVGGAMSFADVSLLHWLDSAEYQLPEALAALDIPLLRAYRARIAARPRIAAYLASARRGRFEGNSFM